MKTSEIVAAMRKRYTQPEWAIFFEVANGTGSNIRRYADAVAMNMFPSRGLEIAGFEFKVSRSDLKKELTTPEKAEAISQYCDLWYLVTPKGLTNESDQIPSNWGLLEVSEDGSMRQKVKPTKNENVKPVTRMFMASLLRGALKEVDAAFNAAVREAAEERIAAAKKSYDNSLEREKENFKANNHRRMASIAKMEEVTGIALENWFNEQEIVECFQFAMKNKLFGYSGVLKHLTEIKDKISKILD